MLLESVDLQRGPDDKVRLCSYLATREVGLALHVLACDCTGQRLASCLNWRPAACVTNASEDGLSVLLAISKPPSACSEYRNAGLLCSADLDSMPGSAHGRRKLRASSAGYEPPLKTIAISTYPTPGKRTPPLTTCSETAASTTGDSGVPEGVSGDAGADVVLDSPRRWSLSAIPRDSEARHSDTE